MLVTLWRHGEAAKAPRDEDRPLTANGEVTLASAAIDFSQQLLQSALPAADVCRVSPLLRTRQSAAILCAHWQCVANLCAALAPGTSINEPSLWLNNAAAHQVLVSHQPFVSDLLNYWLDEPTLDWLQPGGWATVELRAATRGGGSLLLSRASIF